MFLVKIKYSNLSFDQKREESRLFYTHSGCLYNRNQDDNFENTMLVNTFSIERNAVVKRS